ncbi:MAG: hypothetical protein H0W96_14360 [Solirubrobacterales bacterium]|nr:hypothetical protein [Solirubrobacterales bacterium]
MTFTLTVEGTAIGQRARISTVRRARRCDDGVCGRTQVGGVLRSVIGRLAGKQTLTVARPAKGRSIRVSVRTAAFTSGGVDYAAGDAVIRWSP